MTQRLPKPDNTHNYADSGGSFAFENWLAANSNVPAGEAFEYPLFSDAKIVGEITFGPYCIINPIASNRAQVALVLRAESHASWTYSSTTSTDSRRYHGGTDIDEVAALVSLALGCRLKAGDATRHFRTGGDPRGRPWSFRASGKADPSPPPVPEQGSMIPHLMADKNVTSAEALLAKFPRLTSPKSVILVKAARLYQEAVWVADTDPPLAWLLLVSAAETAANYWAGAEMTPREKLRVSKPALELLLRDAGGDVLANQVAVALEDSLGATGKFLKFCLQFLPTAPVRRPDRLEAQVIWDSRTKMRDSLGMVYHYRSLALHAGVPFPAPMATPYFAQGTSERPPFSSMGSLGGTWSKDDIPMLLHVFEYIVRGALTRWWMEDEAQG